MVFACINVDVFDKTGQRFTPREWFCVRLEETDKAISLLKSGKIMDCRYDTVSGRIAMKID